MRSAPVFRISGIQDVMPSVPISAGRGRERRISAASRPSPVKGTAGGSHVQRKYPGIDFHRARILCPASARMTFWAAGDKACA